MRKISASLNDINSNYILTSIKTTEMMTILCDELIKTLEVHQPDYFDGMVKTIIIKARNRSDHDLYEAFLYEAEMARRFNPFRGIVVIDFCEMKNTTNPLRDFLIEGKDALADNTVIINLNDKSLPELDRITLITNQYFPFTYLDYAAFEYDYYLKKINTELDRIEIFNAFYQTELFRGSRSVDYFMQVASDFEKDHSFEQRLKLSYKGSERNIGFSYE